MTSHVLKSAINKRARTQGNKRQRIDVIAVTVCCRVCEDALCVTAKTIKA